MTFNFNQRFHSATTMRYANTRIWNQNIFRIIIVSYTNTQWSIPQSNYFSMFNTFIKIFSGYTTFKKIT